MTLHDLVWDRIRPPREHFRPVFHRVLQTRFNIRNSASGTDAEMAEWSKRRTEIFARVCLPSVVRQEVRPDRWFIICFDQPEELRELRSLVADYPWINIVAQMPRVPFDLTLQEAVLASLPTGADYLLTARTDNDDALALSYFAVMERYATGVIEQLGHDDFWLSPPHGAQLAEGTYRTYMHAMPHFLARCVAVALAPRLKSSTANGVNHTKVFEDGRVVFSPLTDRPLWLQNVHGENISNAVRSRSPMLAEPERVASWFGL